ncbi:MAG: hypothetical protein Kow0027_13080 [Saprospiraceae bacterium]
MQFMNMSSFLPLVFPIAFFVAMPAYGQDSDCNHPTPIILPYSVLNASTCNAGNNLSASPCSNGLFLATEDLFYSYQSEGEECISIALSNVTEGTGIGIYYGCPDTASTCLAQAGGVPGITDVSLNAVFLPWTGTYYLVVDNAVACTVFDLEVEKVECPVVFPPSANCGQAISMNGCNELISDVHIAAGEGDPGFIQPGINDGCWDGAYPLNYTWFSFRAASAGQFAFTLFAQNAMDATDLDFQIWGPVSTEDSLCLLAASAQPIRSSFAAGEEPTGLAAIHPVLNIPVTDFCEDASGDDFVAPLNVLPGEWYLVLVNDWGGGLSNGTVSIDFSGPDSGVLGEPMMAPFVTPDTLICLGDSIRLTAGGGLFYQWISEDALPCIYCSDPVANPDSAQTYSVVISSLCRTDTLSTTVGFHTEPIVVAGPDSTVCGLEAVQLSASAIDQGTYTWLPDSIMGASYQPSPMVGTNSFIVVFQDADGCFEVRDTVTIEWLGELPVNGLVFEPDDSIFTGNSLIIRPDSLDPNLDYSWEAPFQANADSIHLTPDAAGSFEVLLTVTDSNGCSKQIASVFVVLPIRIDFPNVFTPNSDGYNQTFGPVISGDGVEMLSLKIWNRWGELVHSSTGANGWDGRVNGEPAASDVYMYRMELSLPSGKIMVKNGEVTLLR